MLTHPGNVQAVILNSSGYPQEVTKRASEFDASILILHGTADSPADGGSSVTNIEMARQFEAALRKANKQVVTKYYEGSGHNNLFIDSRQLNDTVRRISSFLWDIRLK